MKRDVLTQLRIYLGNIVGNKILSDYTKIAVVSQDNVLNNILAGSLESAYHTITYGRFKNLTIKETDTEIDEVTSEIVNFAPEVLILLMGGDDDEKTIYLLKSLAKKLYDAGFHSDILIDAVNLKKNVFEDALKEDSVLKFFEDNHTYAFTIASEEGVVILNELVINKDRKVELYTVSEYPITFDHGKLLKENIE
jgi:hypothetical protein